ncbi:MAG: hypothetical protein QM770_00565 [Tepidisphaeraceae bacterium]
MPLYQIPSTATRFEIVCGKDGSFLVVSQTTGTDGVAIPCKDEAQATEVCDRLNRGQHDGQIDVPLFGVE